MRLNRIGSERGVSYYSIQMGLSGKAVLDGLNADSRFLDFL